jgi:5'-deoxynucleotidase YfbR-like HD superfamily hydrolase
MGQATKGSAMSDTSRTPQEIAERTAGAVVEMAALALAFGRINRTGPQHPDGTPESDSDHTVMLTWIAPSLAHNLNVLAGYHKFNTYKVAAYAALHDAVEVVVGDTPTIKITEEELVAKEDREKYGSSVLSFQFDERLPWFGRTLRAYEQQVDLESRLVRSIDKMLPKAVHVVCNGQDLQRSGHTFEDFIGVVARQRKQVATWSGDRFVLGVYDALTDMVLKAWLPLPNETQHKFIVDGFSRPYLEHPLSCGEGPCDFSPAYEYFMSFVSVPLEVGEYPVELSEGRLAFVGKQKEN